MNMKNLESYGVVSLNTREIMEIDGGWKFLGLDGSSWIAAGVVVGFALLCCLAII